jgi:hypothetical protein
MKITLNELKQIVRQVIREQEEKKEEKNLSYDEEELVDKIKQYDDILKLYEEAEKKFNEVSNMKKLLQTYIVDTLDLIGETKGTIKEVRGYMVEIQRAGGPKTNYKYKESIDFVMGIIPEEFAKQAREYVNSTKSITRILPNIAIKKADKENLSEGAIKDKLMRAIEKFKDWYYSVKSEMSSLRKANTKVQSALAKLKK